MYDRERIEHYWRLKCGVREIAGAIGRAHSVVSRELKICRVELYGYDAKQAHAWALARQKRKNKPKLVKCEHLRDYVVEQLNKGWSPDQIAGRIKREKPLELHGMTISYESIYKYIYDDDVGEPRLYHKLRRRHPSRRKHGSRRHRTSIIPGKVSIHERPERINMKSEFGHWEGDSMVGKGHKGGLSVQYERKIQLVRMSKINGFTAAETKGVLVAKITELPNGCFKSLTFDNGGETASHLDVRYDHNVMTYHCDPYAAWQKGGVENGNGLIRQYYPKKTDFTQVTEEGIYVVQEKLNNRPRKSLDYATPNELLQIQLTNLVH